MKAAGANVHSNRGKSPAPVALSEWVPKKRRSEQEPHRKTYFNAYPLNG